jgi:hypothetical protein
VEAGIIDYEGFRRTSPLQIDWSYACRTCGGIWESTVLDIETGPLSGTGGKTCIVNTDSTL